LPLHLPLVGKSLKSDDRYMEIGSLILNQGYNNPSKALPGELEQE
jgi:hypothetical protein